MIPEPMRLRHIYIYNYIYIYTRIKRAFRAHTGALWDGPLWAHLGPQGPDPRGPHIALVAPPGPLWARHLWARLGQGPCGPPWALLAKALVGLPGLSWALVPRLTTGVNLRPRSGSGAYMDGWMVPRGCPCSHTKILTDSHSFHQSPRMLHNAWTLRSPTELKSSRPACNRLIQEHSPQQGIARKGKVSRATAAMGC